MFSAYAHRLRFVTLLVHVQLLWCGLLLKYSHDMKWWKHRVYWFDGAWLWLRLNLTTVQQIFCNLQRSVRISEWQKTLELPKPCGWSQFIRLCVDVLLCLVFLYASHSSSIIPLSECKLLLKLSICQAWRPAALCCTPLYKSCPTPSIL